MNSQKAFMAFMAWFQDCTDNDDDDDDDDESWSERMFSSQAETSD